MNNELETINNSFFVQREGKERLGTVRLYTRSTNSIEPSRGVPDHDYFLGVLRALGSLCCVSDAFDTVLGLGAGFAFEGE
jgi:hypothetical protein